MSKVIIKEALALLVIALSITTKGQNILDVKEISGTITSYALSDIRKLTFPTGELIISFIDNTNETFSLSTIQLLKFSDLPTGIDTEPKVESNNISFYPVPVNNELNINYMANVSAVLQIQIFDMGGSVVLKSNQNVYKGKNVLIINLSSLKQGLYICQIINGTTVQTKKIVKQ